MASVFFLLASIFVLANAGPLNREFEAQMPEEENARKMFQFGDQNGDGQLAFEEFVALATHFNGYSEKQREKMAELPEMRELFAEADTNGDGQLSWEEFKVHSDSQDKEKRRKLEIVEFKVMDSNGDGLVDLDEFVDFYADGIFNDEERNWIAAALYPTFEKADKNGDGKLEMEEMVEAEDQQMATTTQHPTPSFASSTPKFAESESPKFPQFFPLPEKLFASIDANEDGVLVYKECMDFVGKEMRLSEGQNERMEESPIPVEVFEKIDQNGDGQISMEEFEDNYSDIMGKGIGERMWEMFFKMIDENGNGFVDYEELVDWAAEKMDLSYQKRNELARNPGMRASFDWLDQDGDGQISLEELLTRIYGEQQSTPPETSSEDPTTTTMGATATETSSTQESSTIPTEGTTSTQKPIAAEIFEHFDGNGDGQWELDEALDYYGNMTGLGEEEKQRVRASRSFAKICDRIDANGDGELSMGELEMVMGMEKSEKLKALFEVVDEDGDGFVEFEELLAFIGDMRGLGDEQRGQMDANGQIRNWFDEVDENGDGKLELEECLEEVNGTMGVAKNVMRMMQI